MAPYAYPMFYLAAAIFVCILIRSRQPGDRTLAMLSVVVCLLLLLVGLALRLHRASYERYILYVVPLVGLLLVRGMGAMRRRCNLGAFLWGSVVVLGIAMILLVQFWSAYFQPLRDAGSQ